MLSMNGVGKPAAYSGETKDGQFHGKGTITVTENTQTIYAYSGEWVNGLYQGKGSLAVTMPESISYTYDGEWKEGLYDGEGALIYDSSQQFKYIGHFERGEYRPTPVQLVQSLCSTGNSTVLSDETMNYIERYWKDFLNHTVPEETNVSVFDYRAYMNEQQNPENNAFRNQITITQSKVYGAEIFGQAVTEIFGYDSNRNVYLGYSIEDSHSFNAGDSVLITGYPICVSSMVNIHGKEIWVLRFLVFSME